MAIVLWIVHTGSPWCERFTTTGRAQNGNPKSGHRQVQRRDGHEATCRAPAWGATNTNNINNIAALVSIRAPAWGATGWLSWTRHSFTSFNSRSRVGSDQRCGRYGFGKWCFNSRSRVGSDNRRFENVAECCSFNSRSRVGSDFCSVCVGRVSIRAPARGATFVVCVCW